MGYHHFSLLTGILFSRKSLGNFHPSDGELQTRSIITQCQGFWGRFFRDKHPSINTQMFFRYVLHLRDVRLSTEEQRFFALLLKMLFSKLPQGGGLEKVAHGVTFVAQNDLARNTQYITICRAECGLLSHSGSICAHFPHPFLWMGKMSTNGRRFY